MLYQNEADAQDIADEHAAADDEDGKPEKRVAYGGVASAEGFQKADHVGALKNDDEQAADGGEACHADHQRQNNPYVQVEQVEPRENLRIEVADGSRRVGLAVVVGSAVHLFDKDIFHLVHPVEVVEDELGTGSLVCLPAVELHGRVEVGQHRHLVEHRQVGLIDAGYGVSAHADVVVVDEVGKDTSADTQSQLVGDGARDDNLLLAALVGELRDVALHHVLMDEGGVVFLCDAFEGHAKEVAVGLHDALRHGIALHLLDTLCLTEHIEHAVGHGDRNVLAPVDGHEVAHGDMVAEAYHFVADGVLETQNDAYGNEHDGQSDGYAQGGYLHSRTTDAMLVVLMVINLLGNE